MHLRAAMISSAPVPPLREGESAYLPRALHLDCAIRERLLALVRGLLVESEDDKDGGAERDGDRRPLGRRRLPAVAQAGWCQERIESQESALSSPVPHLWPTRQGGRAHR